jgi:AbrB family looped-hinge helix DNA binding protein
MRRVSKVTRKGQVTIPAEIRAALGITEGDRVEFELTDSTVQIRARKGSIVERTAGIFKSDLPPMSAKELREAAEIAIAEDSMRRSGMR